MAPGDTLTNAIIGAVVTIVTSFLPVSPLIGGAAAGYLNQRDGIRVGALSGLFAAIPGILLLVLLGTLFAFVPIVGGLGSGEGALLGLGALGLLFGLFVFVLVVVYSVGLGAVGGYLGQYLYEEDVV